MERPFNASATSAGALFSGNTFTVPPFQREYAWGQDEVGEFWDDLRTGLDDGSYFLGLVILTDEESRKHVVDGQQRILTLTILAAALYHEAIRIGRKALAERIRSDFLTSIDYATDEMQSRVRLSDDRDNVTLQAIITHDEPLEHGPVQQDQFSRDLMSASQDIRELLHEDLTSDPFKRLGAWADYLTNRVFMAVFVHPTPESAYRVFEVINTRGRELTTADLLKNFVISQTPDSDRGARYREWQSISRPLTQNGQSNLVQFIRHVVTLGAGHVPSRDLFAFLAERGPRKRRSEPPPSTPELMASLEAHLPLYLQILDPRTDGPADPEWLPFFSALQDLSVITVRPLLMAISEADDASTGMQNVLELVVRRMIVGNLGTGNVERRFGDAAQRVASSGHWERALADLQDLNPTQGEFTEQLRKRSLNRSSLLFMHRSILQRSVTPRREGFLHLIRPRQANDWQGFPDEDFSYWGSTIGNTLLAEVERRPTGATSWDGFRRLLLPEALPGDGMEDIEEIEIWGAKEVETRGMDLAEEGGAVWFTSDDT